MTSSRFRRHRSRDIIAEVLSRADWDARAIQWSGASGAGLPDDAIYGPAPPSPDGAVTPEWWRP